MLIRYVATPSGGQKKRAEVYTVEEHGITRDRIDPDALQITRRLNKHGHSAYIVGGAVRDLLIGRKPKDFDVVTDATPTRIKRLFKNARVIGKRFRLVHVHFRDKIIEVSTFRSNIESTEDRNNIYGKMEEDVHRRDFTMNALYYSPKEEYVIDYVNGFNDVKKKRIRCLIPLSEIFAEDPVRMIRAVKYSAATGFPLDRRVRNQIKKHAPTLANIPVSRLTEEFFKILGSGVSTSIIDLCAKLDLLNSLIPKISCELTNEETLKSFVGSLGSLDLSLGKNEHLSKGEQILGATRPFLNAQNHGHGPANTEVHMHGLKSQLFWESKKILDPLTPPNADIDESVRMYLHEIGYNLEVQKKRHHSGGGRRSKASARRRPRHHDNKKAPSADGAE